MTVSLPQPLRAMITGVHHHVCPAAFSRAILPPPETLVESGDTVVVAGRVGVLSSSEPRTRGALQLRMVQQPRHRVGSRHLYTVCVVRAALGGSCRVTLGNF